MRATQRPLLLTGFEPYGGRGINPSAEVVKALNGRKIAGYPVSGHILPVSIRELPRRITTILDTVNPIAIVSLGLWPGEATIRLERFAVNLTDFEIPDNEGQFLQDTPITQGGPPAIPSRLPLKPIQRALLDAGIPARLSNSAGTFLCNATMYMFLSKTTEDVPCGFVHLPYLPVQVAQSLKEMEEERRFELHQRADLASMSIDIMLKAVDIILTLSVSSVTGRSEVQTAHSVD